MIESEQHSTIVTMYLIDLNNTYNNKFYQKTNPSLPLDKLCRYVIFGLVPQRLSLSTAIVIRARWLQ